MAEPALNPNTACEHGHQRRKCPHCELIQQDTEIATLRQQVAQLTQERDHLRTRLAREDVQKSLAQQAVTDLTQQREEAMAILTEWRNLDTANVAAEKVGLLKQVATLTAQLTTLKAALRRYGSHLAHCQLKRDWEVGNACDCGYDAALTPGEAESEKL